MRDLLPYVFFAFFVFMMWRRFSGKVDPAVAKQLVQDGATLLDVRSSGEFSGGHLPGARNVPVHELSQRIAELGDKGKPVVVYCASGMRSASAAGTLRKAGFARVEDLGGMMRWGS
jgi:phage shock protein E